MTDTPKHSVSVAGVVVGEDGRVLCIQRQDNGHWEPPGGVLELAETPEEGVRREVREETGVDVEVQRLTGVYKNLSRGIIAMVFRCSPLSPALHATEEAHRVKWISKEEVAARMDEAYAIRVMDAIDSGDVAMRSHDGVRVLRKQN